jgi:hypothetical protein
MGISDAQREAPRSAFTPEQIHRRVRYTDWPGPFTESAAACLVLDGTVDWNRFVSDLHDLGISLSMQQAGPVPQVVVQSLACAWD